MSCYVYISHMHAHTHKFTNTCTESQMEMPITCLYCRHMLRHTHYYMCTCVYMVCILVSGSMCCGHMLPVISKWHLLYFKWTDVMVRVSKQYWNVAAVRILRLCVVHITALPCNPQIFLYLYWWNIHCSHLIWPKVEIFNLWARRCHTTVMYVLTTEHLQSSRWALMSCKRAPQQQAMKQYKLLIHFPTQIYPASLELN